MAYLKQKPACRVVLVEKTDRLYRNIRDYATLDELDLEIRFVKENVVFSRDSRSSEKFMHGIKVLMGTLVATPGLPSKEMLPDLLATSDVLGTGWFGAAAAATAPGKTVVIVGDGAVGLSAVIAAKQMGAERIVVMSRHESRQKLARRFGATDIVTERGDEGVARIKELTGGLGAHSVVEAVGSQEAMMQAIQSARAGGHVGFVGVPHGMQLPGTDIFFSAVHLHGGPAPVRRFLPEMIDLVWREQIHPGRVFDLALPLDQVAQGYRAMDERRAIKTLLRP